MQEKRCNVSVSSVKLNTVPNDVDLITNTAVCLDLPHLREV